MDPFLSFLEKAAALKQVKRKGWAERGIPSPESVADHSFATALLALLFAAEAGVDADRAVRMALVHDLAEVEVGDITPADDVPPAEKEERERLAMRMLSRWAGNQSLVDLWEEYAARKTPEARFVAELNTIEMLLQALAYGKAHQGIDLSSFWKSSEGKITTPALVKVYQALLRESALLHKS